MNDIYLVGGPMDGAFTSGPIHQAPRRLRLPTPAGRVAVYVLLPELERYLFAEYETGTSDKAS